MDRIKRTPFPKSVPEELVKPSTLSKWIPLLCAGAAAGVSIIALQEIKKVRRELIVIKRENSPSDELGKRMETMESQLQKLTDFITNKENVTKDSEIIRNVVQESGNIKIINNEEYEEVEVTDDETEEN